MNNFNKATIQGTIQQLGQVQHFESGFFKQEIVIDTGGEYAQQIQVSFLKDKTKLLQRFAEGQQVEVAIDIRGREYNGRFFNDLVAWKIEESSGGYDPQREKQLQTVGGVKTDQHPEPDVVISENTDPDDLPF